MLVEIDGSYGEGGGQILRTALTLSSITSKPFRIYNIRKNREKKGLSYQHLTVARAVRKVCRGNLEGDELRGETLEFYPGKIVGGRYEFKIPTAGSGVLLAQTIIPILLFSSKPSSLRVIGGTHVKSAPSYDYFELNFLKALSFMGIRISSKLHRSGYYPEGNGLFSIYLEPSSFDFPSFFPEEDEISVLIRISSLPFHIALREKKVFLEKGIENVKIIEEELSPGNAILVKKGFNANSCIGEKGLRAETLAKNCLEGISDFSIDKHLADQLMLYASLASLNKKERVEYEGEITSHSISNAYVIEKFLPVKIELEDNKYIFTPLEI